ncbi:MAG: alpha/beta hydrolase [Proteobacteria bacterium]|nr:alpha/beta hydrolase [Pseudomonadota bacterium]
MNTERLLKSERRAGSYVFLALCLAALIGAVVLASRVQTGFGRVEVTNATYPNYNGIPVRAKLFRPRPATRQAPHPGVVYIHGYQNNRETGDAYCLELARRGFVVLDIDAIGRGNSGLPGNPKAPDFDPTYGGRSSLKYLAALPFVNPAALGMVGHSLGAEMAYRVALSDPSVKALVITGFAYTLEATADNPKNMLMIIGQYDEFRRRMTGTRDIEKEWMASPRTRKVIPEADPKLGATYGDFARGTARRVFVPRAIHIQESHSRPAIAETLAWMKSALDPPADEWIDPGDQIWPVKEWATLAALILGVLSLMPLGLILLRTEYFRPLQGPPAGTYACTGWKYLRYAAVNGLLMWLYLPSILILFAIHIYVVHIDGVFPMMMVNGIVWWFLVINLIGGLLFRRWYRKQRRENGPSLAELGLSWRDDRLALDAGLMGRTAFLALILFAFAYLTEHVLESLFIVDYRFLFPFASDLTPQRAGIFLIYLPFLVLGFLLMGVFVHGQMRRPLRNTWLKTFASWSGANVLLMVAPLLAFLMVQYVPLLTTGAIPLVGPGGMFVSFVMNIFHIAGVLILVLPLSTWLYQLTGRIYLGALVNALLVTWMFVSSQVVAPIPV